MSAHTPGDWTAGWGNGVTGPRAAPSVHWDGLGFPQVPIRAGEEVVAWVVSTEGTVADLMPDAHLLAAARDLLDAARAMTEAVSFPMTNKERKAYVRTLNAIAKAEGREG